MNENNAILSILAAGALLVLLFACFVGCKSLPPAVLPQVHSEHNGHDRDHSFARGDSIHIKDSIVYRYLHDTLMVDRWHTEYRDRWRHDTLTVSDSVQVTDSVPYPVEVVKEVPRERSGYDRFCSWFFWITAILLLLVIAYYVCDKIPATKPYTAIIRGLFKWL